MSKLPNRVRELRKAKQLSLEDLAEAAHTDFSTIAKIETGKLRLSDKWIAPLAKRLGVSPGDLFLVEGGAPAPRPKSIEARSLPVFGLAAGAVAGEHQMSDGPIDEIPAPPGLAHVVGAYALLVHGESMMPRYYPRDRLYINPHQAVVAGDHVVIQTRNHDGDIVTTWVKRYDGTDGDEVLAWQYNPPAKIRFKKKHVLYIHRVLPINELV